jgi:hypothetical protein
MPLKIPLQRIFVISQEICKSLEEQNKRNINIQKSKISDLFSSENFFFLTPDQISVGGETALPPLTFLFCSKENKVEKRRRC